MADTNTSDAPKAKEASRVITLDDIKFNEANKVMAIVSCIPIVGLVMLFAEKKDLFVRYFGAQFALVGAFSLVTSVIPCVNLVGFIIVLVAIVMGIVKASKGERFDIPVISDLALKLMNAIQ